MSVSPLQIFVFNSLEDEWKFTRTIGSSYLLADSYLYMNSDYSNDIVVTPIPVSTLFKTYVDSLVGIKSIVYSPVHKTHSICKNIIADKRVFTALIKEAKKRNNSIVLKAYVSTSELLLLRNAFKKKGVKVLLPENTEREDLWTIDFFGSKSGFRSLFSSFMPKGSICYSIPEAIKTAQGLYKLKKAIVIKTNKGNSGEGIEIIKNKINPDFKALFSSASYWKNNPIVIEEFIDTTKEKLSRFPSIEGFITPEGKVTLPYFCNMIVTKEGEFYGIEMHKDVVTEKVRKEMNKMTIHIGKTYADAGYRGRFDVDYLYDGKILYANESNTRTNGGTDTYFVTRKLIGSSFFSSRYVLSNYLELNRKTTFHAIQRLLAPIRYDKKKRIGFILGSENALRHKGLSFILIGNHKDHTLLLFKKMSTLLKSILTIKKNKQ